MTPTHQLTFRFASPTIIPTNRADGAYLVLPGKPEVVEDELPVSKVAQELRYSERHIRTILRELGIAVRQRRAGCKMFVPRSAVERLRHFCA